MRIDPATIAIDGEDGSSDSGLKTTIAELERRLRDEKDSYAVLQSQTEVEKYVARQEADKGRRDCATLEERVARLEHDCATLRERVLRDQERIKSLLREIEEKEKEFKEKFVELKVENRDLQCGKGRAQDEVEEWKRKYWAAEVEKLRFEMKEKEAAGYDEEGSDGEKPVAAEVDGEMPRRNEDEEDVILTPKQKKREDFVVMGSESECEDGGDEEDRIPLWQFRKRRRVGVNGAKKTSSCLVNRSTGRRGRSGKCALPLVANGAGNIGEEGSSAEGADVETQPTNGTQEDSESLRNSKQLLEVAKDSHELLVRNRRPRSKKKFKPLSLRCASTAKSPATSDCNGAIADLGPWSTPKSKRSSSNQKSQGECNRTVASSQRHPSAQIRGEELLRNLNSDHPAFVKSLLRSHVSSCFWLSLPVEFCEDNLPSRNLWLVLEDEKGIEYKVHYIGARAGIGGGWKGFATSHDLEVGDALVFELSEPTRFKVYVVKASADDSSED